MNLERELNKRSNGACELCGSTENLKQYDILPQKKPGLDESIYLCNVCLNQIENPESADANHWRCLNDSMWSEHIPVQVMSYRLLKRFGNHELAEQIYMDEETLEWAKATAEGEEDENKLVHRDSNGVILNTGDSVVLIKDLKVKGSSMVAKQGTAVRNIRLDHENETYIEGRVDGQQIVIITQYVKKL